MTLEPGKQVQQELELCFAHREPLEVPHPQVAPMGRTERAAVLTLPQRLTCETEMKRPWNVARELGK